MSARTSSTAPPDLVARIAALSPAKRGALVSRLATLGSPDREQIETSLVGSVLCAYVAIESEAVSVEDLRRDLEMRLPSYMLPTHFSVVEEIPRGPRGKVDLAALPAPGPGGDLGNVGWVEPETDDERAMAAIWADVLGMDLVGMHDDFFELGGHSLLAVQLLGRIREAFQVELPMDALFEGATVAATVERVLTLQWAMEGKAVADDAAAEEEFEV